MILNSVSGISGEDQLNATAFTIKVVAIKIQGLQMTPGARTPFIGEIKEMAAEVEQLAENCINTDLHDDDLGQ